MPQKNEYWLSVRQNNEQHMCCSLGSVFHRLPAHLYSQAAPWVQKSERVMWDHKLSLSAHGRAEIQTQILFLPIKQRSRVGPGGGSWHSAWISDCTAPYIIYNSLSLALLPSSPSVASHHFSPSLLIYSIPLPKHPSFPPFFPPTQFSCRFIHQVQLTSPPLPGLDPAAGSP